MSNVVFFAQFFIFIFKNNSRILSLTIFLQNLFICTFYEAITKNPFLWHGIRIHACISAATTFSWPVAQHFMGGAMDDMVDSPQQVAPQQWSCWPARERPLAALLACALILLLAFSVLLATGDWMWGALACMGMFLALIGFFLPTDIVLSEDKIIVREPLRVRGMRWDSIQVCKDGGDALLLIQRGARRSRQGRLIVPLGRGEFTQVRKRAVEQVWQQHRSS